VHARETRRPLSALRAGARILVDPWLTGDLVFAGQTWLYRGMKTNVRNIDVPAVGQAVDLLVISQVRRPSLPALHNFHLAVPPLTAVLSCPGPCAGTSQSLQTAVHNMCTTALERSAGRHKQAYGSTTCAQPLSRLGRVHNGGVRQGLPDHAHEPTLRQLPKELPVVASPSAARIAADLGFKRVYELDHGQEMTAADGRLRIRATAGAAPASSAGRVGPGLFACVAWGLAVLTGAVRGRAGALVGPPWSKREFGPARALPALLLPQARPGVRAVARGAGTASCSRSWRRAVSACTMSRTASALPQGAIRAIGSVLRVCWSRRPALHALQPPLLVMR